MLYEGALDTFFLRFLLKKKGEKTWFFRKYGFLASKTSCFLKIQLFSPFFSKKKREKISRALS